MTNPLTGDFDAVLQVNGTAVNRLLASMHQNIGVKPDLPSFPHSIAIRIGDPDPIDGMRGTIVAQISVPQIELIHAVSDRFWLEVAVRARYTPDPGSVPMPEFIHGSVRAQYRIENIDPTCLGWEKIAQDYLWIRVVRDTVSFTGTAVDDISVTSVGQTPIDPSVADARITEVARHLLWKRFKAKPHQVTRRFRRGAMRSLNIGVNKSLVAIPIGISGEPSPGNIDSINQDVLDKKDVAIAISRDFIIRRIQEQLDALEETFHEKFEFYHRTGLDLGPWGDPALLTVKIQWTVTIKNATAQWIGGISPVMGVAIPGGLLSIALHGEARTDKKVFNFDFDATQMVLVTFDAASEEFAATAFGAADVSVLGVFGPVIQWKATPELQVEIANAVNNAAKAMTGELSVAKRKGDLVEQLQTMDDNADVSFTNAAFSADGVVVRGNIQLSSRRPMVNTFVVTAQKNGYSAFGSWIPGGRIDSFNWSWRWFNQGGKSDFETITDRYLLRRPAAEGQGKFGLALGVNRPLPGLDGMGQMCLVISGVRVHPVTGQMVPVTATRKCKKFGFDLGIGTPDRLFLREWTPGPRDPIGPVAETAVHEVSAPLTPAHGTNTLVVRVGSEWNREVAMSLRDGLIDSRRHDAGLVVLILFGDGELMRAEPQMIEEMRALAADLEAPLVVNEDVEGSWSKALRIEDRHTLEWRLLTPTGGMTWTHSGHLDARNLARTLDGFLFPSPMPRPEEQFDGLSAGSRIPELELESDVIGQLSRRDDPCPPAPFNRIGLESAVTFVKKNSSSSDVAVKAMSAVGQRDDGQEFRIVVLDGGTPEDAERMKELLPDVTIVPDPDGRIAKRFGVQSWPSSIRINESGAVAGAEVTEHE